MVTDNFVKYWDAFHCDQTTSHQGGNAYALGQAVQAHVAQISQAIKST